MADITEVTEDDFGSKVLENEGLLLVYYYATWCKPCQELEKIVQEVASETAGQVEFVSVNTDVEEAIVKQQNIRTIPTLEAVRNGKPIALLRGLPSKEEILEKLRSLETEGGGDASAEQSEA